MQKSILLPPAPCLLPHFKYIMIVIKDKEYGGERPLYTLHDARLERVTIHLGESSIKESGNIEA